MSEPKADSGAAVPCISLLAKAFTLGFMVSREGFNGECAFEHCAPNTVEAHYETVDEFLDAIEKNEAFTSLRESAVSGIANTVLSMDRSTQRRLQGAVPPAGCACGCGVFVWWLTDQGRYSSETPWQYYDRNKHIGAVCAECNRTVPKTHNTVLSVDKSTKGHS